jgi:futalosine hydrolase
MRAPFFNSWPVDQKLLDWARPLLLNHAEKTESNLSSGPFVTVSTCTGSAVKATEIENRTGGICENMEGAAVALACQQLSVPLLEIRGISNLVEDRDSSRWDLPGGMISAQNAIMALLRAWPEQRS